MLVLTIRGFLNSLVRTELSAQIHTSYIDNEQVFGDRVCLLLGIAWVRWTLLLATKQTPIIFYTGQRMTVSIEPPLLWYLSRYRVSYRQYPSCITVGTEASSKVNGTLMYTSEPRF